MAKQWGLATRRRLATATAAILAEWKSDGHFDNRTLLAAFREAIERELGAEDRRTISSLTSVPWLWDTVMEIMTEPTEGEPESPPPPPSPDAQLEMRVATLEVTVEQLRRVLIRMKQRRRRRRADVIAKIGADAKSPHRRVAIAGIEQGNQQELIRRQLRGHPIEVDFIDVKRTSARELPKYDRLIVMTWTARLWKHAARESNGTKFVEAGGVRSAIDLAMGV